MWGAMAQKKTRQEAAGWNAAELVDRLHHGGDALGRVPDIRTIAVHKARGLVLELFARLVLVLRGEDGIDARHHEEREERADGHSRNQDDADAVAGLGAGA